MAKRKKRVARPIHPTEALLDASARATRSLVDRFIAVAERSCVEHGPDAAILAMTGVLVSMADGEGVGLDELIALVRSLHADLHAPDTVDDLLAGLGSTGFASDAIERALHPDPERESEP